MTSRELHDRVGGYPVNKERVYWLADEGYQRRLHATGHGSAIVDDIKVFHANGPYYSEEFPEKQAYWRAQERRQRQKDAVKRVLLRIPFGRRLNTRYGFFVEPQSRI